MVRSAATLRVSNHEARLRYLTSLLGPHLLDFGVAWQIVRAFAVRRVDHDALAVLQRGLAGEGAQGRLMVDLAEGDLTEWRRHRKTFGRGDQLLRIGRARFGED